MARLPHHAEKFLPAETESQTFTSTGLRLSCVSSFSASQDSSGLRSLHLWPVHPWRGTACWAEDTSLLHDAHLKPQQLRPPLAMPPLYRCTQKCPQTSCLCITRCSVSSGLFPSPGFTRLYHSNITGPPTILLSVRSENVLPADSPRASVAASLPGTGRCTRFPGTGQQ